MCILGYSTLSHWSISHLFSTIVPDGISRIFPATPSLKPDCGFTHSGLGKGVVKASVPSAVSCSVVILVHRHSELEHSPSFDGSGLIAKRRLRDSPVDSPSQAAITCFFCRHMNDSTSPHQLTGPKFSNEYAIHALYGRAWLDWILGLTIMPLRDIIKFRFSLRKRLSACRGYNNDLHDG